MKYLSVILLLGFLNVGMLYAQNPAPVIPEFNLFLADMKPFTQNNLPQHKKVFILFFDTECSHCQQAVQSIGKSYKSFKGTDMFLVSVDDQKKVDNFMNTYGKLLKGQKNITMLFDKQNQFITRFRPRKYPAMFLYGADRKLVDYEDNEESVFRFANQLDKMK